MSGELHTDVAAHAAGLLDEEDRTAFEAHLARCDACRAEAAELAPLGELLFLTRGPVAVPPPGLEARTLLAVREASEAAAAQRGRAAAPRGPLAFLRRRPSFGFGFGAAVAIAGVVGALVLAGGERGTPPQRIEVAATLIGPRGQTAVAEVTKTGIGRVVRFDTRDLPILPKGEYYELWWVGEGDRRGRPNRISAGTFHPDDDGRSLVQFAAAVDPAKFPRLAITAEPGDGDPSPHGPDVMVGRVRSVTP